MKGNKQNASLWRPCMIMALQQGNKWQVTEQDKAVEITPSPSCIAYCKNTVVDQLA